MSTHIVGTLSPSRLSLSGDPLFQQPASTVTCNLGTLSSGDSVNVTIVVVPNSTGDLTNVANVTHGVDDPDTGDNTVTQTAMVVAAANLAVTKSDSTDPALIEEPLTHSVTVTNNGPSSAIGMGSLIPCRSKSPSNPRQRPTARVLKPQES